MFGIQSGEANTVFSASDVLTFYVYFLGICVSGFLTLKIITQTRRLAEKELQAKEFELKNSLFDKRYEVYRCFKKYYNPTFKSLIELGKKNISDMQYGNISGVKMLSRLIFNDFAIYGKQQLLNDLNTLENIEQRTPDEDVRYRYLTERKLFEDVNYWNKEIEIIKLAEFLYEDEIANLLIKYVEDVLDVAFSVNDVTTTTESSETEFSEKQKKLLECIKEVDRTDLIEKVKKKLNIKDYED